MPLDRLQETRRRWNCFAKVDQLGAFDFYTYTISLDAVQRDGLAKAQDIAQKLSMPETRLSLDEHQAIDGPISLAVHEYTHFVDASSTLWGVRHLQLLDAGNRAIGSRRGEEAFPSAKRFFDHVRSIRWPDYYTEHYQGATDFERPWTAAVTGGRVFDAAGRLSQRPIVFVRFGDRNGSPIVRSPLSTVSVLEASAYGQEIQFRLNLLKRLSEDTRLVEAGEMSRQVVEYIYNSSLTEYSVCAHLFANRMGCTDVAVAYASVALLSRWALNMPKAALPILLDRLGEVLQGALGWSPTSETTELVREGLRAEDIGTIFYVLVCCLPPGSHRDHASLVHGLHTAIGQFSLDEQTLRAMADAEMAEGVERLSHSPLTSVRQLAAAGAQNFGSISWNHSSLRMADLNLPSVVLGDLSLARPFSNRENALSEYDVNSAYDELVKGQIWIERFAEACF